MKVVFIDVPKHSVISPNAVILIRRGEFQNLIMKIINNKLLWMLISMKTGEIFRHKNRCIYEKYASSNYYSQLFRDEEYDHGLLI